MRALKLAVARTPLLGRSVLMLVRAKTAFAYFRGPLANLFTWLWTSRETTNFTYDLQQTNQRYLASLIALVLDTQVSEIERYLGEINSDSKIRRQIWGCTQQSELAFMADKEVRFGRRIGWYAFVRALKPQIVVETGVDKGMGSCVLCAALKKNTEEGYPGRYFGTDINPKAGYLLSGEYARFGTILYGDSIASLQKFNEPIDLFINDSDHSADYEAREYETISTKLSPHAVILADNAHATDKLSKFSLAQNRRFVFFQEKPDRHWYPGAGIGISLKPKA